MSISIQHKEDLGANIIENINNSTRNIININSNNKLIKKSKRKFPGLKKNLNNNFSIKNLRNSVNVVNLNKYKSNNINNGDIIPNPPLKKNAAFLSNILDNNRYKNQNQSLDSSSSDNKTLFKNQFKGSLKNQKIKLFFNSKDFNGEKPNKLISSNQGSISFKNEDITSKKQLLQNISKNKLNIQENQIEKSKPVEKEIIKKNIKYIDAELNKMDYENALIYDQRDYLKYYISLLKKKHLIILVFISNDDYNVFLLKFSLFILSISLFFSLNTLFFRDSTMKHLFKNEGKFDFLYQIPQVLYSTIISSIMTFILKKLSLSQNDLIQLKKQSDRKEAKIMANKAKKRLKIKLYIFFFIGLELLLFCWYYITAFCAVYPNTQIHLLKDTLISFGISMLYPFIINLIPGLFRIPSLKAVKKDKKCLYNTSKIISKI